METVQPGLPIFLLIICVAALAVFLLVLGSAFNPRRPNPVKRMPYESGMDPIHDTRRRFDVRFHLLAIAFLVFDVELLFLYPWAVTALPAKLAAAETAKAAAETSGPAEAAGTDISAAPATWQSSAAGKELIANRRLVFNGVMVFVALLALGLIYDWRKGIFEWR